MASLTLSLPKFQIDPQTVTFLASVYALQVSYQSLNTPARANHTDYYVVMSPGASRTVSQEDTSDQSGDSVMSHREHLSLLEAHNRNVESAVAKNTEDIKKLMNLVEHLNRRIESLAHQLRIMTFGGTGQGSEVSSASGSPTVALPGARRSSPICVDNRPPAPLPGQQNPLHIHNTRSQTKCLNIYRSRLFFNFLANTYKMGCSL